MSSPNRSLNQSINDSSLLERSLVVTRKRHKLKTSLLWLGVNCCFLGLVVFDLCQTCPLYKSFYHCIEYSLIIIFTLNVLYYIIKVLKLYFSSADPIAITEEQKKLLGVKDADPNYTIVSPTQSPSRLPSVSSTPLNNTAISWRSNASPAMQTTPLNMTALSWRSNNMSQNDSMSMNYSMSSPSWNFHKAATNGTNIGKSPQSSYLDNIDDEDVLDQELKEEDEALTKLPNKGRNSTNLLSSFWSHPATKTAKDMSTFLKKSQYQLSTQSPTKAGSPSSKEDASNNVPALEVWTRINVDTVALTQWNENLRMWISQTILERLVKEFDQITDSFEKHSMSDIKIGSVGLDRLRKTALMSQISHFIPSLSTIIPFLELHGNQVYLVKRIRELARGGCMSEFKWNGGGHYNGKDWDDSLPTDCAIIMHLLSSYLDTQLIPSPNLPDTKAFSNFYYLKETDKIPTLNKRSLYIQEVTGKPPHYRVIVGEKIYEMVKGYNNLFHSILFFVYHVNKQEQGMLGRVNLGRAGVNMLWIVGIDE